MYFKLFVIQSGYTKVKQIFDESQTFSALNYHVSYLSFWYEGSDNEPIMSLIKRLVELRLLLEYQLPPFKIKC